MFFCVPFTDINEKTITLNCYATVELWTGWTQIFGEPGWDDKGSDVKQTTDGGYIIVGSKFMNTEYQEVYLIKTDENGEEEWSQTFNISGGFGFFVIQASDGGYVVVGKTGFDDDTGDGYLMKLDENGTEQWVQNFPNSSWLLSVTNTNDGGGGYITCGREKDGQKLLIKITNEGIVEWYQTLDSGHFNHIRNTTDGGYIISGTNYMSLWGIVVKTDENFNEEWSIGLPVYSLLLLKKLRMGDI